MRRSANQVQCTGVNRISEAEVLQDKGRCRRVWASLRRRPARHPRRGGLPHQGRFLRREAVGRVHQLGDLLLQALRFRGQRL